jgi:nucleoside-diphosphate-sugar epimerase
VVPWLYGLPGGVYQDFLPHALYVLLEYTGAPRELKVMQRTTGVLPQNLPDEIRILINGEDAFGTVTFSFAAKPHLHFIRVYGTRMMTEIDINTMTAVVHPVSGLPKAAQKVIYNIQESWQQTTSTVSNVYRFLTGKLKPYHGMMTLIHLYYDAIRSGNPPPVSRERALLVIKTMDEVFKQLKFDPLKHERIVPDVATKRKHPERILVTGGTGFVGKRLVERLIEEGYAVRVLARKLANVDSLRSFGAEIFWGDVADLESFEQALIGNDIIVHLAAGTSGSEKDCKAGTLQGTKNVLELCRRHKPRKLVYISSCSVYGVADFKKNQLVPESASLERFPEKRGSYSASKQEAETYVTEFMKSGDVAAVILRPGTIYGPGGDIYTPMMGFSMGRLYVIIGNGKFLLPFVYIDNLVEAIIGSIETKKGDNQVFNVVDMDRVSKREYMNKVIRKIHPDAKVLYFPYSFLYGITWFQEIALGLMKRRPFLTRYRLDSSQRSIIYDNRKIVETLGWHPRIDASEAIDRLVAFETSK